MRELREFESLLNEELNPNDYGGVMNVGDKDYINKVSFLEKAFTDIEGELVAMGKSDASAKSLVSKAFDELVDMKAVDEIPGEDAPDGVKMRWVSETRPRVKEYLVQTGELFF